MVGVFAAGCSFEGPPAGEPRAAGDSGVEIDAPESQSSDAAVDAALTCPAGYGENAFGTCYRFETSTPKSWQDAETDCESEGAHLVVVDTQDEDAALPDVHWIGYSETVSEGTYVWVTGAGRSSYENWAIAAGEPDLLQDAYCAVTRPDNWHDDNCFETKSYVCEYDGIVADPSTWDDSGS